MISVYYTKVKEDSMRTLILACLIGSVSLFAEEVSPKIEEEVTHRNILALATANNAFAFNFFNKLKNEDNVIFSPYSILSGFVMAELGAAGETLKEMEQVLQFPTKHASQFSAFNAYLTKPFTHESFSEFYLGNALWLQAGFPIKSTYQTALELNFNSHVTTLDFLQPYQAINQINQWVSSKTQGKIHDLLTLKEISPNTRLVLTSAIYMKSIWNKPFNPSSTTRDPFFITETESVQTDMMHQVYTYQLSTQNEFSLLKIPYRFSYKDGPILSMVILLPNKNIPLDALSEFTLSQWEVANRAWEKKNIRLSIPKFHLENRFELNGMMKSLGLNLPFTHSADFSQINDQSDLYISSSVHATFLSLDEQGTEAAAATAVSIGLTAIRQTEPEMEFTVNRPFIFFIVEEKTETILFMGKIVKL